MPNTKKKIAIVYDWIDKWGGVERVLLHLHTLFPSAHFFTSTIQYTNAQWARKLTIHPSFLQSFPSWLQKNRALMSPLYPLAFESFQFDEYDLVISVTSAFAKGIITKPHTKHLCYLLTPPRYLWTHREDYLSPFSERLTQPLINHLKRWDLIASQRPDGYLSISQTVADRAKKIYNVDTPVTFPPFDTQYWDMNQENMKRPLSLLNIDSYYLWVGRMETYKKIDLVIDLARHKTNRNFIFVGTGSLENKIKKIAPKNCHFTGLISDTELSYAYTHAKALIMPQNEDFGYVSLEAQYHGCPVIAFRSGGACETIGEGQSGMFFDHQSLPSLVSVLERFEQISYNLSHSTNGVKNSIQKRFGIERFNTQFFYQLKQLITL